MIIKPDAGGYASQTTNAASKAGGVCFDRSKETG